MMTLTEWIAQLPENWDETADFDYCVLCREDEVWDYNICIACAEDMNENESGMDDAWYDADTFASVGWGTDEDYGYYGD